MPSTSIPWGDGRAGIRFSVAMAYEIVTSSFFGSNFISEDGSKPIHRIVDLEQKKGADQVRVDKWNQLSGPPVVNKRAVGSEEKMDGTFMPMWINMARKPVSTGGTMDDKRTVHNLREVAKNLSRIYWSRWFDEEFFVYASGRRGNGTKNWLHPTNWNFSGFANNTLSTLHADNIFYPSGISAETAVVASGGTMSRKLLEYYDHLLDEMDHPLEPLMINGEEMYIYVMSNIDYYYLRLGSSSTDLGDWAQLKKYGKSEKDMPWNGILGRWGRFLLFKHNKIVKNYSASNNSGAGGVVCDNLILGAQALALAHGNAGNGMHFSWWEGKIDNDEEGIVQTKTLFGVQRVEFESTPGDSTTKRPQGVVVARTFGGTSSSI